MMPDSFELLQQGFFEQPFRRYADTRYFYPGVSEQRKVLNVANDFIYNHADPSKNLALFAGPSGGGKSMLAMKIAQTHYESPGVGQIFGVYLNTNMLTEPRHFLMALVETLSLPSSRSNANRIESIFERLENSNDQLLIVLDGPPVDHEYLTQLLEWSIENSKKIKTIIFLQDINNVTSNLGSLSQFLGLYVPFRHASQKELIELLYYRMLSAGKLNPSENISEERMLELVEAHGGSISEALNAANEL
jgi:Cdc6-like AAA superfamily ATPase